MTRSSVVIAHLFPELLGLYGDRGNALVLAHRARLRGVAVDVISVAAGQPIPAGADVYLLGGAEDAAQVVAAQLLLEHGGRAALGGRGAVVLAVCAGLQLLGVDFSAGERRVAGLGLVDATTIVGEHRAVGELVTQPVELPVPALTGFENHRGRTMLGPDVRPLGRVVTGIGNGGGGGTAPEVAADGFVAGRLVGTYLHGPILARNPALADLLLEWVTGDHLAPLDDRSTQALREERLGAVLSVRQARRVAAFDRAVGRSR